MRAFFCILSALLIATFINCGGSTSHPVPPSPVFISTPVTDAAQGTSYTYTLAANDPSGGAVTFSLTASPAGATLAGSTISWTPTASQSRVSNSFTVKAKTPSGGSATQSWAVTPSGTVTVNWTDTYWTAGGPVQEPASPQDPPAALVPQLDGSLTMLTGDAVSPGVFNIVNVPGGYYWLIQGTQGVYATTGFWTNSSTFDLGRDFTGSKTGVAPGNQTITFDFNLNGMDPALPKGNIGFLPHSTSTYGKYLAAPEGATSLTSSASVTAWYDWTTVDTAFLMQYQPSSVGTLNSFVAGPTLTLNNLALTNGVHNPITATLQPSPESAIDLSIAGSQWEPIFQNVGPGPATPGNSWLSVTVEPYVVGRKIHPAYFQPDFPLVQPNINGFLPTGIAPCPGDPVIGNVYGHSAILSDQDFGSLQYGDPFPAEWTRAVNFCQSVTVPFLFSGINFPIPLTFAQAVAPSNSPLVPVAAPVVNPTINGSSLFSTTTLNQTAETLSWSAPAGPAPFGYTVQIYQVEVFSNGFLLSRAGSYGTAKTSVTIPPLNPGAYLFYIITNVDGIANMQSAPYRSQLPMGFAPVMSSVITIGAGASSPQLHGDAKAWQRLLHARDKAHRITGTEK